MLRALVLAVGTVLLLVGLLGVVAGHATGAGLEALVVGALMVGGTVFEKLRYGESRDVPRGADWVRSDETFIDPTSGRTMVVFEHRRTGKRRYVPLDRG